ncbi:MAG: hypothetical protein R2909_12280 [Gemmatimonadales bacterium]
MSATRLRHAFMLFHAALGGVLLIIGHNTLFHAIHQHGFGHLAMVAALEMLGAILLLIPRTLKIGGVALLVVLVPWFVVHLTRGEWELQLLIYATGVWLVMMHGPTWGRRPELSGGAA